MEATSVAEIPVGPQWQYEPKWDGFRCLVSRDGDKVVLQSKAGRSLNRYFPEIVAATRAVRAARFTLDGELVVPIGERFSFDDLLQRIHPAASRVAALSEKTPALLIVFDLLQCGAEKFARETLPERRAALEAFWRDALAAANRFRLSPATTDVRTAQGWLRKAGTALDGIIAKRRDLPYRSGTRDGMQKIKLFRSADCVVGGFRYNEGKRVVGSLLLGLYDRKGLLNHVGFTSAIPARDKKALTAKLEKLIAPPGFTGAAPGGPSRWSTERSSAWCPLKPKLVVEVCYDHFSGHRFRHGTRLLRWRPDKAPQQCRMDQVAQKKANLVRLLTPDRAR
ncbi:MAG: ATP-dependent DNA ligase [Alphaproteobacteria bacterium]|nr:ATP-dependent DNA ligase [Alphaproteobacteria bacterium]